MRTGYASWPAHWLVLIAFLVFSMVAVGGLTRLTESGLSIVEWKPVRGIVPPLDDAAWQQEFVAYRSSPEYKHKNSGMDVDAFKRIFWLEYLHRLLGRAVGLVVLLPLLWLSVRFVLKPSVSLKGEGSHLFPAWLLRRMWLIACLIGLQGVIGWYMVKSGLINQPWVSPYRLALHLGTAVILFALVLVTLQRVKWNLSSLGKKAGYVSGGKRSFAVLVSSLVFAQILFGALMAGSHAGYIYNTFPLMDGDLVPQGVLQLAPWWKNLFENVTTINFLHRWLAFAVAAAIFLQSYRLLKSCHERGTRRLAAAGALLVVIQIALGITTLVLIVPIWLAVIHQCFAVLLFGVNSLLAYRLHVLFQREPVPSTPCAMVASNA